MQLNKLFHRTKTANVLITLNREYTGNKGHKQAYKSSVAKESDMTYSHAVKVINELIESKLITEEKEGRVIYLELTYRGKEVANLLIKLRELIE